MLFLLLLNSVLYPNLITGIYFIYTLVLTVLSLTKDPKKVKLKFILTILIVIMAVGLALGKTGYLIYLNNSGELKMSEDERLMLNSLGVYIELTTVKIKFKNTFWTVFYDVMEALIGIIMSIVYASQRKDVIKQYTGDEKSGLIMHPNFERYQEKICVIALICLVIETIFVQTIIQAFIVIVLILLLQAWANNQYERYSLKLLILSFSQYLLTFQLIVTFILDIGYLKEEISQSDYGFVFDMFGFILHNLPTYTVVLHLLSLTLCIQALQIYKVARFNALRNVGLIPDSEDEDKKSDNQLKSVKKRLERNRTIGSGGVKSSMKTSVVGKFRERTMGLKQKLHDESSIQAQAQRYYKDFSPQIWFWCCRISAFIWCYAYHDFQSWIILMWIMHSTIFTSTKRFVAQTIKYYLPAFVLFFMFYYIINIPRVIEFSRLKANYDTWTSFGFYQFSIPSLEVSLMMLALLPFFFLIKSKQYLDYNKEDQKRRFLEKLTAKDSSTLYYLFFSFITNLDLIVFITIFFSGVNKIDFYHVFLLFFFVTYILAPHWFKTHYIILLYYVNFFVFEKYLYTLVKHYIPDDSPVIQFLNVIGFSTDYDEDSNTKYFRYTPKFQQWLLVLVVFLQYQIYRLLSDEALVDKAKDAVATNFKARYPKLNHFWELLQHLKKECLILITFVVFFMMIIFSTKSLINWGFQIIICFFIITYVGVGNEKPADTGIKRLHRVWGMVIWYASVVLILQITYQFAALPIVRKTLRLDYILDLLPTWIRQNLNIIGFQVYTKYIWQKFLIYLMYFAIGVYVKKQMESWNSMTNQQNIVDNNDDDKDKSRNSDMQEDYFHDHKNTNWKKEYLKIRFTTPYLVYKLRKLWIVLDKLSQILFIIISVMIMILSNYWQISLSMAIHLTCFIMLCLVISSKLYENRQREKKIMSNPKFDNGQKYVKQLTVEECGKHWTKYKSVVNGHQVRIRQQVWFFQFVLTLLCIVTIYPTEFLYQFRTTFLQEGDPSIVSILEYLIFYLFWGGVYHSPEQVSGHGYFYNVYGYLIILILLIFEKNAQKWALDRFGCTPALIKHYQRVEENLDKKQPEKEKEKVEIAEQVIVEEEEQKEEELSMTSQKNSGSGEGSIKDQEQELGNEDEIREEVKKWIMKKYKLRLLNGVKILLEDTIQLLMLISCVYKDSVIGLVLLFGVFMYLTRRKIRTMARLAWIVGVCMIIQYGMALSNLTSDNNPMDFPDPFKPYPSQQDPEGRFFIPWYKKVGFLADPLNFKWAMYLGMGISNTKMNGLWIDYFIMGCISAHLFYFGCQLFSIDLKIHKGEHLVDLLQRYCLLTQGETSPEIIKKETKKLKRTVFMYNFYKSSQLSIFMHFHQITIVVTLLLAILARSLFSFGYIIVCMFMIYENHKFFRPRQKNFRLQNVLKYWLRPYVFIDLTLQLIYQIPLDFLHDNKDAWSWQNIIGFQDIWVKDPTNKDEVVGKAIIFMVLKAFTYYFVTMQIQIFDSTSYKTYINKDFKKFIDMADTKAISMIWKYNNEKLEKIKQQKNEKQKMDEMLTNLKKVLKKWQSHISTDLDQQLKVAFENKHSPPQKQLTQQATKKGGSFRLEDESSELLTVGEEPYKYQRINGSTFKNAVSFSEGRQSHMPQISEEEDFYAKDDEILLETAKKKLPMLVRFLIWAKKACTEQITFISSENYLKRVALEMQAGQTNIYTKMERKMLSDIRDLKRKKIYEEFLDIDIKEMKRTREFIKFGKVVQGFISLFVEILVTYSDSICYILMIVSMMKNAGFISLVYPFVVFGYALFEEVNPRKKLWYSIMIYTEVLIMIKFLFQLSIWDAIYMDTQLDNFQNTLNAIHVGLHRKATGAFGEMFAYFLPEILILLAIMSHIQKEIMTGILYHKEDELETIEQAFIRYMKSTRNSPSPKKASLLMDSDDFDLNVYDLPLRRDVKDYYRQNRLNQSYEFRPVAYDKITEEDENLQPLGQDQKRRGKSHSLVDQEELVKLYNILQEKEYLEKGLKKGFAQKSQDRVQRLLYKNAYFQRLFPSIKEQKPGKDLYALIATSQFLICIFMIFFYTKMDADVTNISESLTYNQFSGHMVIALFLQILVMIIDRYLYKSKTFISVQEKFKDKKIVLYKRTPTEANTVLDLEVERDRGKSFIQFLQHQSPMRGNAKWESQPLDSSDEEDELKQIERQIVLENTKITLAMVSKFYLQWFLLLFVHAFVFWYFPIMGNIKLQNHSYCVKETLKPQGQNDDVVRCNEFGVNWALVVFYILYCFYFWVSALQVRFGVPEMKKGNFMMNSYGYVNTFAFKGFMAIPFLFELKTFVDWTFTRTALDVFQWIILSSTHAELFIARCLQGRYQRKPLGKQVPWFLKLGLGGMGQIGIILLIAGPLLLFSTFNPISTANPVTNALVQFNILIEPEGSLAKNTINLFTNNYVTELTPLTQQQFDEMDFSDDVKTKSFDINLIQFVKMNNFADTSWSVSLPNRQTLKDEFEGVVKKTLKTRLFVQFTYSFDRSNVNAPTAHFQHLLDLTLPQFQEVLADFSCVFSLNCTDNRQSKNATVYIPSFFTGVNFLTDKEDAIPLQNDKWNKGLKVFYSCMDYYTVDQVIRYNSSEAHMPNSNLTGVSFFTFSNKIAPSYFKFSIVTFYISIVLVIGKLIRSVLVIGGNRIFIYEIPNSEQLLQLCECIYIYRMRSQLDKEEQLYFTFVDIMRSPEMIKAITGSAMKKKQN